MYKRTRTEGFGPEVKRRIMLGSFVLSSGYYDAYYLKALRTKALIKQEFDRAFEKYDVLLAPAAPYTAPKIGESLKDPMAMYLGDIYTVAVNLCRPSGNYRSLREGQHRTSYRNPDDRQLLYGKEDPARQPMPYEKARGEFRRCHVTERRQQSMKQYETVIGLEVHVELATRDEDLLWLFHSLWRST